MIARSLALGLPLVLVCAACAHGSAHASHHAPPVKRAARRECAHVSPAVRLGRVRATAHGELAPSGALAIRLCRYSGLNAHPPQALVRVADVRSPARVAGLVRRLNRLPAMPSPVVCPNDDASQIVLLLSYPRSRTLTISAGLSGCTTVTNGGEHRTAARGDGPRLVRAMKRILRRRGIMP
jgi:hypothetical protein